MALMKALGGESVSQVLMFDGWHTIEEGTLKEIPFGECPTTDEPWLTWQEFERDSEGRLTNWEHKMVAALSDCHGFRTETRKHYG